ncbi:MAG: acyl-ACP thioesterase domain-containing protein [Myxococcota bacterium]
MSDFVWEFSVRLPRDAYTDRETARAGGVWRVCQDTATLASIASGWPPSRFRREGVFFIVYRMVVVHELEPAFGDALDATTWVSRLRRDMLSTREVRLRSEGTLVAAATQEWVHVDADTRKPKRAERSTAAAFPPVDVEPSAVLPSFEKRAGASTSFEFRMWESWADPLGHANHPDYIDWCDEGTSRYLRERGVEPSRLRAVAEQVTFKDSVLPGEAVLVRTEQVGLYGDDAVVLKHRIETERGTAADATSIRRLADDRAGAWRELWA